MRYSVPSTFPLWIKKLTVLPFFISDSGALLAMLPENSKGFFCSALSFTRSKGSILINLEYAWSANDPVVVVPFPFAVGSEGARVGVWPLRTPMEKSAGSVDVCEGSGCTGSGA